MKRSFGPWCVAVALILLLAPLKSFSSDPATDIPEISSHVAGSYYPEHKHLLIPAFKKAVYSWLRKYDPKVLSEDENSVRMQTSYRGLYELKLGIYSGGYQVSAHLAKRVMRVERARHLAAHLANGIIKLVEEDLREPKRQKEEKDAREKVVREAKEREETRRAQEAAAIAEDLAMLEQINSLGKLRAYPKLASYRYGKCERLANIYLDADLKVFKEQFESGLDSIKKCTNKEESALTVEVRLALSAAGHSVSDQLKDLHAYTVASLRALANFHQSEIEARRSRAERAAGIDERTTRIELEL